MYDQVKWLIMDGNTQVGRVVESSVVAGQQYYTIWLNREFAGVDGEEEWLMCDTHDPKNHLACSSFSGLCLWEPDWVEDDDETEGYGGLFSPFV